MATVPPYLAESSEYPTSDGKPMAETDWHRILMVSLIEALETYYAAQDLVYVSGNLLIFYEPGNRRRHVSPDVFVVKGVPKRERPNYLVWRERKGPDVVIELTSSSTRREDTRQKFDLYQNTLRVREYFLFDPNADYLNPPLQGYRLVKGEYTLMRPVAGRLRSRVLGLHLERQGRRLRLYDPSNDRWLPTPREATAQAEEARRRAEEARRQAEETRRQAEAEAERLRRENEQLRRRLGEQS
jgi:Uma2 family endonuclease